MTPSVRLGQLLTLLLGALACGGPAADGSRLHSGGAENRDGDPLSDAVDACPDDAEDEDGFEDEDGCPDVDNDQDRILDVADLCPDDAEDMDRFEDADGCPDVDNDQDRILDTEDQCPSEAEVYNGLEDEDGCPDVGEVTVYTCVFPIIELVYFGRRSSIVRPVAAPIIDALAAVIEGNPDIELVGVVGHAASNERAPERIAEDRARAVVDELVSRGIAKERLRLLVAGARDLRDATTSARAHERNRRVELHILRRDGREAGRWDGTRVVQQP